ncbi:hypothetical protein SLEP1_g59428 [Rubroshorea leprosula]|uniref:heme oxygenase (biliverdin-producing) n=1 Tax=Rubroshorea leprosula TaxID=152421 RepID=A0AAV5MWD5_9ROSI|nr:hypothetical protein SLEP1_g59428 [Rubroshorea leprosula]
MFSSSQDCSKILMGGPYKMFDHYLTVQSWESGFYPARDKAPKTVVWVKLHGVPIVCFYEAICLYLGNKIGKQIKVDPTTLLTIRRKFVRVCVEVDLNQQLPSSVGLDLEDLPQALILVEYEGLHKICFHCEEFGHTEDICHYKNLEKASPTVSNPSSKAMIELTQTLKPNSDENPMVFGPWMVQQWRSKRWQLSHGQAKIVTNSIPHDSTSKIVANSISHDSRSNWFAMLVENTEDDLDLLNSNKDHDNTQAGVLPQNQDLVGSSASMDIVSPNRPPPSSTAFAKPKPKKRKAKVGGLVPKDTKPPTPKPYQLPSILKKQQDPANAEFRNTGLERSEGLAKDLDWFKEQGYDIPEPSSPGRNYAEYLKELSEKDPQAFICHFYNIYFAHSAGGRMIGKKVAEEILNKKELEFYKWDGDLSQLLQNVRDKLNKVAERWTREEKNHCLEETEKSFKYSGEILRLILS